MSEETVH